MSTSPIRVGFVGLSQAGWATTALVPALLHPALAGRYRLTALSTRSEISASATAQKYSKQVGQPVKAYHGDASKLASDPDVDLVVVSVRVSHHRDAALPAIEAGKDVFIEWPAGSSLQESIELAEASRRKGIRTMVGLQGRHSPAVKKVKELVNTGMIGRVTSVSIIALVPREMNVWGPRVSERTLYTTTKGASLLSSGMGHQLDILTHILGDFESVSATSTKHYPIATIVGRDGKLTNRTIHNTFPDHVAFTGLLKSGAICSVIWRGGIPLISGRRQLLWEIDGEDGSICIENEGIALGSMMCLDEPNVYLNGELVDVGDNQAGGEWRELAKTENRLLGNLTEAWNEFAKGDEGQYATLEDSLRNHRLIDAIQRSSNEGRTIVL